MVEVAPFTRSFKPEISSHYGLEEKDLICFVNFIDFGDNCWFWKGTISIYPRFSVRINGKTKSFYASKLLWELRTGKLLSFDVEICHKCKNNYTCIRPEHIYLGTHADNIKDQRNAGTLNFAKLTKAKAVSIRLEYWNGSDIEALAISYGVSTMSIRRIISGETWK